MGRNRTKTTRLLSAKSGPSLKRTSLFQIGSAGGVQVKWNVLPEADMQAYYCEERIHSRTVCSIFKFERFPDHMHSYHHNWKADPHKCSACGWTSLGAQLVQVDAFDYFAAEGWV